MLIRRPDRPDGKRMVTNTLQVAHYGLPAAGIIALSLLRQGSQGFLRDTLTPQYKLMQDLSVFVAEVQGEGLIHSGEPNYSLLHRAAYTIQRLLQAAFNGMLAAPSRVDLPPVAADTFDLEHFDFSAFPQPAVGMDSLGCEMEFWDTLGQHPFLLSPDQTGTH